MYIRVYRSFMRGDRITTSEALDMCVVTRKSNGSATARWQIFVISRILISVGRIPGGPAKLSLLSHSRKILH